jgi:hypothetical protein
MVPLAIFMVLGASMDPILLLELYLQDLETVCAFLPIGLPGS